MGLFLELAPEISQLRRLSAELEQLSFFSSAGKLSDLPVLVDPLTTSPLALITCYEPSSAR